jgi:hypothetical protein
MKRTLAIIGAAFAVALAVVIGNRMSADAMAVVVGVVCGVLASIPTSLLLIWALGRRGYGAGATTEGQARNNTGTQYPPVVVVNPGPGYGMPGYGPSPPPPIERRLPPPGSPRTFKVVGDEETMLDELRHTFPGLADE